MEVDEDTEGNKDENFTQKPENFCDTLLEKGIWPVELIASNDTTSVEEGAKFSMREFFSV